MTAISIGYARCSTDKQDLEANRQILLALGVPTDQINLDRADSGTNRDRPGPDHALAAVRTGDTLVVPKLDRLARSRARRCTESSNAPASRQPRGGGMTAATTYSTPPA